MTRELNDKSAAKLLRSEFALKGVSITHTEALDLVARLRGFKAWSHLQQSLSLKPLPLPAPAVVKELTLSELLAQHFGEWGELPQQPRNDWSYQVENGDTNLGYWDWVENTLASDEDTCPDEIRFQPAPPTRVTLPDGQVAEWELDGNLTDRWGDLNYFAAETKPGLALLTIDLAAGEESTLLARLRSMMWGELTFVARKDGKFGLLFEVEYASLESEAAFEDVRDEQLPHAEVVARLLAGLRELADRFPTVSLCVPDATVIIHHRPAVWAFVPMADLADLDRDTLGRSLMSL